MADLIGFVVSQFSDGEEDPAAIGDGGREMNAQEVLATIGFSIRFSKLSRQWCTRVKCILETVASS